MATLLVAALLAPVLGALAAALVPSGRPRHTGPRRGRRASKAPKEGATEASNDATSVPDAEASTGVARTDPSGEDPEALQRAGATSRSIVRVAALAGAALWTSVALGGPAAAGPWTAGGPVAPAAAGACLVLAAAGRPDRRLAAAAAGLALAVATSALALAPRDEGATLVALSLAAAAGLGALAARRPEDGGLGPATAALAGITAVAAGLLRLDASTGGVDLPVSGSLAADAGVLLVGGTVTVAVAAALRPRHALGILLPVALALGVPVATLLGDAGDGVAVVLLVGAATVAGVWALLPRSPRNDPRPLVIALTLAAFGSAAVSASGIPGDAGTLVGLDAGLPAAWLLASAAVVSAVSLVPVAALAAVPGAAALTVVLVADPTPLRLALVALGAGFAVAAAAALARPDAPGPSGTGTDPEAGQPSWLLVATVPALAAGVWLVAAPQTWTWVGPVELEGWSDSLAVVLAGGLAATVAGGATGRLALPRLPHLAGADPVARDADVAVRGRLALATGAVLGLALVVLVASTQA